MKKGWEECNLEDYIKLIDYRGRTPTKTETGVRLITAKNVKLGYLRLEPQEFIAAENFDSWMTRGIPNYGDVIFTTEAPLANVAQIDSYEKLAFAQRIIVMQPKANKLDQTFLKYMLLSENVRTKILEKGTGATVQGIKSSLLKKIKISFPSLAEQKRIVALLDEAFAAIAQAKANAEQNLKNAKELFESYLQGVFETKGDGWEEKTLGDICEYDKIAYSRIGLPYIGLEDIQSNTGRFIGSFEPKEVKSTTFNFSSKHVLYGRLRPYLNKVLLPNFEGHCSTEIFPLKPKMNILNRAYLFHWLISIKTMKKIDATWTGATLPRANMNLVLEFKINIPSLKAQQSIVEKLDALNAESKRLENVYRQKIGHLESLKKSILQKAFSGAL